MDLYAIDENKKVTYLEDVYRKRFQELFNTVPVIDDQDRSALYRLVKAVRVEREKLAELITGFFELDDEFVRKSGYKLQFIDSRANAIATMNGRKPKAVPSNQKLSVLFHCDKCSEPFQFICPMNYDWNKRTLCPKCAGDK